jgi:nitroimidazol reductase NimA-like FMN-containing flavoprotein (pyridoxamine 5'-phosphate oxidase superfamily)
VFIDVRSLMPLTTEESLARLRAGRIGRVAFTMGALPAVVPVTYAVQGQHLLLATAADSRLARAADGNVLAFEIDEVDLVGHTGWSVVVTGVAQVVADAAGRAEAASVVAPWLPERAELLIRLPCTRITGRRITVASRDNADL